MEYNSKEIAATGKQKELAFSKTLKAIKQMKDQQADALFQDTHDQVFENMNCLECANCCKTTSPVFTEKDIERISKHLRIKPGIFTTTYLNRDDEGDMVLKSSPCAFLNTDNTCQIYEYRPTACKGYPHTNRKKIRQLLNLTLKNSMICPAVQEILQQVETAIKNK